MKIVRSLPIKLFYNPLCTIIEYYLLSLFTHLFRKNLHCLVESCFGMYHHLRIYFLLCKNIFKKCVISEL